MKVLFQLGKEDLVWGAQTYVVPGSREVSGSGMGSLQNEAEAYSGDRRREAKRAVELLVFVSLSGW